MAGQDARSRRATAVAAAGRLTGTVKLGGDPSAQAWYVMLLDIRDVLGSPASDEQALEEAAAMFRELYKTPRNFSDFYIWREDEVTRIRENEQFDNDVRTLQESLNA